MEPKGKFAVGDVVQLNSGGPTMTVQNVPDEPDSAMKCIWFSGDKVEEGHFAPALLKAVDASMVM
jgi:uncharacterized protein YodC (DUF2158 family)